MATITGSISKNSKNFSGGVDGVAGVGKTVAIQVGGTPEAGDKFNIKLGGENFGFVGKPIGRVSALETLKDKVYAGIGSIMYYSGIGLPTQWDYETDSGAGFNNMSSSARGSEDITGLAIYQGNMAVFQRWSTQIWFIDPLPEGNRQLQVLDNIGALSPRSIVSVGDIDVFFLSDSGLRSLRARDSSNAAFISDVGTPVDPLIINLLRSLTESEKKLAVAAVEPEDGRYWLALGEYVYVFSYFSGAKISAWGRYLPPSPVRWISLRDGRVRMRCEDGSYLLYGGADNNTYDDTQVRVLTPFMDVRQPGTHKQLTGADVGIEGEWLLEICTDINAVGVDGEYIFETIGQVNKATFSMEAIPVDGNTTHFALRLTSFGEGYARLANIVIHYDSSQAG